MASDVGQGGQLVLEKFLSLRERPETSELVPLILPSIPQMRKTRRLKGMIELDLEDRKYQDDTIGMTGYYRNPGLILYIGGGITIDSNPEDESFLQLNMLQNQNKKHHL